MRGAAIALLLLLGLAMPAAADTVDVLKANTLALTAPGRGAITVLVGEDGRMQQVNARGMWAAGFWSMTERGFCWTARGEAEVCIPLPADKAVGDSWEIHGPTGRLAWTAEIQAGRADPAAVGAINKGAAAQGATGSVSHQ